MLTYCEIITEISKYLLKNNNDNNNKICFLTIKKYIFRRYGTQ